MNQLITNYLFSASAKTVTLPDIPNVKLEQIRYIKNITRNSYLYLFTSVNTIVNIAGSVITFATTTSMTDTDKLVIQYDDGIPIASEETNSNLSTAIGNISDTTASSDSGNFTLLSLFKRLLNKLPPLISGRLPVDVQSLNVTLSNAAIEIANDVGNPIPMSAANLPLPAGASTSGNQTAGNNTLLNIDAKLGSPITTSINNFPVTQAISATSFPLPTGAATSANQSTSNASLSSIDTKTPSLGQANPTASTPVVLSNEIMIVGTTATAINTNLLTGNVSDWHDATGFNSACIQIIGSAGISAGQIIFEQTNDSTLAASGQPLPAHEVNLQNANPQISAIAIAANSTRMFNVAIHAKYIRVRISTAFVGGTLRAVAAFSQISFAYPTLNIQQATAANLNATVTGSVIVSSAILAPGTNIVGDVGIQYRANATGASSKANFVSAATTNSTILKASAGRLLGWQLANTTATWLYLKLHNSAIAPTAGVGIFFTIAIPPNAKSELNLEGGIAFATGISFTTVTEPQDTDATSITANGIVGSLFFA